MGKVIQLYGPKAGAGFELTVTLHGVTPAIWRRLAVAGSLTLRELHHVLQIALGWEDKHLHEFAIDGGRYGMTVPGEDDVPDEREFTLEGVLHGVPFFRYVYDYGDDWVHDVAVKPVTLSARAPKAACLDGERAAPLEDCGGPDSYMDLLKAISKPGSARGRELLEWAGPDFAPLKFDRGAINRELRSAGTKAFLKKRERFYEGR